MLEFKTFERVENMAGCIKKPIVVHARQMDDEFWVSTLEGYYAHGKPGDYLIRGAEGELYVKDRRIFETTYDWVTEPTTSTPSTED